MNSSADELERHQKKAEQLNLSQHTSVLGVDILTHPKMEYALVNDIPYNGGLSAEPELTTWQGEPYERGCRREIAAWARRTLFAIEGEHAE